MSTTENLSRTQAADEVLVPTGGTAGGTCPSGSDSMLVALGVDGTIVADGDAHVPPGTADAIQAVVASGHHVALATGRSLLGVLPVVTSAGMTRGWIVASDGAVIARVDPNLPSGYEVADAFMLDVGQVVHAARMIAPDLQVAVEIIGWGHEVTGPFPRGSLDGRQGIVHASELPDHAPQIVLRSPNAPALIGQLRMLGVTANLTGPDQIHVNPPLLSRATALFRIRRQLGVDPERTLAIGADPTDLRMLTWASKSVAMGDAPISVRRTATVTTGTLHQHGAASTLEAIATRTAARAGDSFG